MTHRLALASVALAVISTAFVLFYPNAYGNLSCGVGGCVESHHSFLSAHCRKALLLLALPIALAVAIFLSLRADAKGVMGLGVACAGLGAFIVVTSFSVGLLYILGLLCLALAFVRALRQPTAKVAT